MKRSQDTQGTGMPVPFRSPIDHKLGGTAGTDVPAVAVEGGMLHGMWLSRRRGHWLILQCEGEGYRILPVFLCCGITPRVVRI